MDGLTTIKLMVDMGVEFVSLNEQIDTNTANGKMILTIFLALAEWESNLIAERTAAGVKIRQENKLPHGRPHSIMDYAKRIERMRELRDEDENLYEMTAGAVMEELNKADKNVVPIKSITTVHKWIRAGYPGLDDDIE